MRFMFSRTFSGALDNFARTWACSSAAILFSYTARPSLVGFEVPGCCIAAERHHVDSVVLGSHMLREPFLAVFSSWMVAVLQPKM